MYIVREVIYYVFLVYIIMLMIRILGSWFPRLAQSRFMRFISFYTDPYLNLFRKIIPPLGGVLDISPIVAFLALRLLQFVILNIIL